MSSCGLTCSRQKWLNRRWIACASSLGAARAWNSASDRDPWIVLPNPKTGWPVLPLTIAAVAKSMQGH
jgi:hypothetical protein